MLILSHADDAQEPRGRFETQPIIHKACILIQVSGFEMSAYTHTHTHVSRSGAKRQVNESLGVGQSGLKEEEEMKVE